MKNVKKITSYGLLLACLVGAYFTVTNSQNIIDWWQLRNYSPTTEIEALTTNSGMNDYGQKLFYVHDPELQSKADFGASCTVDEQTIVLGCYISRDRIFLFDVEDERLAGVEEVTAAHEMLHAAYDRLSFEEKDELSKLLSSAYANITDERIQDTVLSYENKGLEDISNELHSILGTEVRELPSKLEDHYSKYFEDRIKVVDLAENYAAEFKKREAEIEKYDSQLTVLQGEIARSEADISQTAQSLNDEKNLIKGLSSDPEAYNQAVGSFNAKVNTYNREIAALRTKIDEYNKLVSKRNAIALEERELVEAVDTRVDGL